MSLFCVKRVSSPLSNVKRTTIGNLHIDLYWSKLLHNNNMYRKDLFHNKYSSSDSLDRLSISGFQTRSKSSERGKDMESSSETTVASNTDWLAPPSKNNASLDDTVTGRGVSSGKEISN